MQPASEMKSVIAGASNAAALPVADNAPRADKKWIISVFVPLLVPIIGIAAVVVQYYFHERSSDIEKKAVFCRRANELLVDIDESLKKTGDSDLLARWSKYEWDKLDTLLADLRKLYLDVPAASADSIAAQLKSYSEYVGETWRGSGDYGKCPEPTRKRNYLESRKYLSEVEDALTRYRAEEVLRAAYGRRPLTTRAQISNPATPLFNQAKGDRV